MVKARKYVVTKQSQGLSKREDFDIVEEELPPLRKGEILVKAEWISVDPYLRVLNTITPIPYDQFSCQIGVVTESKNSKYPVGTRVVSHKGWRDYSIVDPETPMKDFYTIFYKLPDLKGLATSLGLGAIGAPGATAYFGFLQLCKPQPGETVVVTAAAGAVGSIVGQIAKIKDCRVIGFAGSYDKVRWLESIGFDKAFNYKSVDVSTALDEAAPKGVDCYFDNVGGEVSNTIISKMNVFGRVAICGCVSSYNDDPSSVTKVSHLQPLILWKQLKIEGFLADRWLSRWPDAFDQLMKWILSGQLKVSEHVTLGFENICDAYLGLFKGDNTGKAVVKV